MYCRAEKEEKKRDNSSRRFVQYIFTFVSGWKLLNHHGKLVGRMYACYKKQTKKKLHGDSQCQSIFFYSSVCMTQETIWMCEVMYCTVVMPYTNKMSSSSASVFNSYEELSHERDVTAKSILW